VSDPPDQMPDKPAYSNDGKDHDAKTGNPPNPWVEALQTLGLSVVLAFGIRHFVAEARYIPTGSMEPTLLVNDRLVVEKVSYHFNDPQREQIVVFYPPDSPELKLEGNEAFIKRIVGLPGEVVEIRDGMVYVNGEGLDEAYIQEPPNYTWGPQEVPPNAYMVLGDNRNSSFDSHAWGFVPEENIIGRALVRFWPPGRVGWLDE